MWCAVGLSVLVARPAQAAPVHLLPVAPEPGQAERWLVRQSLERQPTPEGAAEYFRGLPWSPPRLALYDAWRAEPFPGVALILGTVGAMTTSFDGYRELAGVREPSQAYFPGVRLVGPALASGQTVELGAGFLVGLDGAFRPDRAWGVFAFSGRL
jgi:hypothetical protein